MMDLMAYNLDQDGMMIRKAGECFLMKLTIFIIQITATSTRQGIR